MNAAWKNLWPDCAFSLIEDSSLLETVDTRIAEIVTIWQQLEGEIFRDLNTSDNEELLQSHTAELTSNGLI